MRFKQEAGYDEYYGVELYPPESEVMNNMNARHIWLLCDIPDYVFAVNNAEKLDNNVAQRLAGIFTVTDETVIRDVSLMAIGIYWWYDQTGAVRIKIMTESGGKPSETLVDPDAVTAWMQVSAWSRTVYEWQILQFKQRFNLSPGTYFAVVEGDEAYNDSADAGYYIAFNFKEVVGGQEYDKNFNDWFPVLFGGTPRVIAFSFAGLDTTRIYDYAYTYNNSTYRSESRRSEGAKIQPTSANPTTMTSFIIPTDNQVDVVKIYRRSWDQALGYNPNEALITDEFSLVAEVTSPWASFNDTLSNASLGPVLDSDDHYAARHTDDTDEDLRDAAIIPTAACYWHDRVWITDGSNNAWMSKTFERDNSSGLTNDPTEDYFPLKNKLNLPVPSGILALEPMSDDQLVIYFQDGSAHVIWGTYSSLNPPADIQKRNVLSRGALFGQRSLDRTSTRHVLMTRDGLWGFAGTIGIPEFLSETNQSILDDIENTYLENTRVLLFGNQIWVLHDPDNDGQMEEILILDMLRDVQTRQLVDRAWRTYEYDVPLNDIVLRRRGDTYSHILAADAINPYIMKLGQGTLDNGSPIVGSVEMHNVSAKNLVMLSGVELDAKYPGTPPTYTIYGISGGTVVQTRTLSPTSDTDIRRHRTGLQVMAVTDARLMIEITSTQSDELKSFLVNYVTE